MYDRFFKQDARHAWFLEIALTRTSVCLRACVCAHVFVCPLSGPLITSHVKGIRSNQIIKFYGYFVSLYDTAIDKLNRRGLSNTVGCE